MRLNEETLQTLQDHFRGQHFATDYRCQLTTRTQRARESLQDFATAIEQLAHRAYSTLLKDHIWREAGKAFAYRVEDPNIKIQVLLGGEKTVNRGPQAGTRITGHTRSSQAPQN
jgi:hypothetical protein